MEVMMMNNQELGVMDAFFDLDAYVQDSPASQMTASPAVSMQSDFDILDEFLAAAGPPSPEGEMFDSLFTTEFKEMDATSTFESDPLSELLGDDTTDAVGSPFSSPASSFLPSPDLTPLPSFKAEAPSTPVQQSLPAPSPALLPINTPVSLPNLLPTVERTRAALFEAIAKMMPTPA
ncbi:hypothetical protein HK097_004795, partial [Rhizophlyctis rosea]